MKKPAPDEQAKQLYYRDARTKGYYDKIWQSVGKCVFCDLRDKYIFYEENGLVMTVALFAYIDGNFMIIPRRHIRSVKELSSSEWATVRKMMYMAKKAIKKAHGLKGMQFVLRDGGAEAQSTVSGHLHIHCIPFDAPDLSVWNFRQLRYTPLENAAIYKRQSAYLSELAEKFDAKYAHSSTSEKDDGTIYKSALKQALLNQRRSKARKTAKVGATIIVQDRIIAGCNQNMLPGPMEYPKDDGTWTSPPSVVHAEEHCIATAAQQGIPLKGGIMIVTLSPCMTCARLIVGAGIKELHYIDAWWDKMALDFLKEQGIVVKRLAYKQRKESRP